MIGTVSNFDLTGRIQRRPNRFDDFVAEAGNTRQASGDGPLAAHGLLDRANGCFRKLGRELEPLAATILVFVLSREGLCRDY